MKPFQIPDDTKNKIETKETIFQTISIDKLIKNGSVAIVYDPNFLNNSIFCNKEGELIFYYNSNGTWDNYSLGKCSGDISVVKNKQDIFLFFVDQNYH